MYIGSVEMYDSFTEIYTSDMETFTDKDGREILQECLFEWALWLNSPWSDSCVQYVVEMNTNNTGMLIDGEPAWRCKYSSVGYDACTGIIYGYGRTADEAKENCNKNLAVVQAKFNPEDESV